MYFTHNIHFPHPEPYYTFCYARCASFCQNLRYIEDRKRVRLSKQYTTVSLYFLLLIYYRVLTVYSTKGKSALQTINKHLQGALLFVYFVIDTIFILGDGLTSLLLRWEKSAPFLSCSWISWAKAREGCQAVFEPGAAKQQPLSHACPTLKIQTMLHCLFIC
jgi:hypothetical protein